MAPFLGFGLAVLMHAAWNGSAVFFGGGGFFVTYFMVMGPALVITLMVTHFQLKREGRLVQQFAYVPAHRANGPPQPAGHGGDGPPCRADLREKCPDGDGSWVCRAHRGSSRRMR